jgi:hypothetical protein
MSGSKAEPDKKFDWWDTLRIDADRPAGIVAPANLQVKK